MIDPPSISTNLVVSICLCLMWCVSWNFSGANIDAYLDAHCLVNPSVVFRPSHISSVVSPHRRIAISSMYPVAMVSITGFDEICVVEEVEYEGEG